MGGQRRARGQENYVAGFLGQHRSVGWVTLRSVDVVIAADTVTRQLVAALGSEQFIK